MHRPYCFRSMDDDSAPIDYTFAPSVSEAKRRQQAMNIPKEEPKGAVVRHRASPFESDPVDAFGTRGRRVEVGLELKGAVPRGLPSAADGPAPAASIAYPQDYGIPDNPFQPPVEQELPPRRASRAARVSGSQPAAQGQPTGTYTGAVQPAAQPQERTPEGVRVAVPGEQPVVLQAQDGSQYEAPTTPPVPEWLRVAQQNHLPSEERMRRAPRVQAAPSYQAEETETPVDPLGRPLRNRAAQSRSNGPQPGELYQRAGYPQELVEEQRRLEQERAAQMERRRHGAQYAVASEPPQERRQQPPPHASRSSYPPARDEYAAQRRATGAGAQPMPPDYAQGASRRCAYAAAAPAENAPAVRHQRAAASPQNPYAQPKDIDNDMWSDEESEQMPMYAERAPIPWLGIAMFAAAIVAVGLWLMQLTFTSQTEQVIRARRESTEALYQNHPYRYEELIEREAEKNNLHPAFVAAIVLNESTFDPQAESNVGARGLMQVMDDTAQFIYEKLNGTEEGYNFNDLYTAETNVEFGCWYLAYLSERFRGDPVLVAASYHAGPTEVQNWLNDSTYSADNLTLELERMKDGPTKQYATRVLRDYSIYKKLYYETTEESS